VLITPSGVVRPEAEQAKRRKRLTETRPPRKRQNLQDLRDLAKRSEQEKKEMDFAEQENKNDRDILAYSRIYILPYRYINSTKK